MTDRLRAAAKAALEALDKVNQDAARENSWWGVFHAEIEQLRAALAEPEVEPYIWYADDTGDTWTPEAVAGGYAPSDLRPLYTLPPRREWRGLTDEEMADAIRPCCSGWKTLEMLLKLSMDEYRAIEAALKEKNHDL